MVSVFDKVENFTVTHGQLSSVKKSQKERFFGLDRQKKVCCSYLRLIII